MAILLNLVKVYANPKHKYTMGAQNIAHSTEENDLGVVINQSHSDMKVN